MSHADAHLGGDAVRGQVASGIRRTLESSKSHCEPGDETGDWSGDEIGGAEPDGGEQAQGSGSFVDRAQQVIEFVETLTNTAGPGAGKPFLLRDWQKDIIRQVYGPTDELGYRIVRTALLTMARKNGKTELIAALCLAHLCGPARELNGQIYSAAADREQAGLVSAAAAAMVRADAELSAELNIIDSRKRIVHYATGSFYQAVSSESKTKHGFNASVILYDELAQAPNRELYDVLTTSTGARAEPLTWIISTQCKDPAHLMSELTDYGRKVLDGAIEDPTFVAFIYEVPKDADAWDERHWPLANPALGDFRSIDEMRLFAQRARRMPSAEATFRNLYLNQRVDAEGIWIATQAWLARECYLDLQQYRDRLCYGGLDLSGKNDLTALVLDFPTDEGHDTFSLFWTPEKGLSDREDRDRVPYTQWHRDGFLRTTPGRSIDYGYVAQEIAKLRGMIELKAIAFDRYRIDDLLRELDDIGITCEVVSHGDEPKGSPDLVLIPHGQGFKDMNPAVEMLETSVLNEQIRVDKNPVMTMCALNAVCTTDPAGSRKFDKRPGKSTGRIDGLVALAMAHRCANAAPRPTESVYETRGITFL